MPFDRPTLGALIRDGEAAFAARIPGADLTLRRSNLKVSARVFAGLLHQEFGYLDWQFRQLIPDTAEAEYLDRWARIYGVPRKEATVAAGSVVFAGTNGTLIPAGTRLTRPDGVLFATVAPVTIAATTATVGVLAVDGGAAGNQDPNAPVSLVAAIPGVIGVAAFTSAGSTGGTDVELDEALRARLLDRIQQPPQGGTQNDFEQWALAVPGVTRAWAFPNNRGPGTVDLTFVMDDRTNIIPSPADVAAVQAAIDLRRPVTADTIVFAPTAITVAVTIDNLAVDTTAVRNAIGVTLAAMFRRDAAPGATLWRSRIWEAISAATGEEHHVLTAPAIDVVYGNGQMPVLGVITFT